MPTPARRCPVEAVPSGPWEEKGCDFSWRSAAVRTLGLSPRGPGEEEGRFGAARALSHKGLRLDGRCREAACPGLPAEPCPRSPDGWGRAAHGGFRPGGGIPSVPVPKRRYRAATPGVRASPGSCGLPPHPGPAAALPPVPPFPKESETCG